MLFYTPVERRLLFVWKPAGVSTMATIGAILSQTGRKRQIAWARNAARRNVARQEAERVAAAVAEVTAAHAEAVLPWRMNSSQRRRQEDFS